MKKLLMAIFAIALLASAWTFVEPGAAKVAKPKNTGIANKDGNPTTITLWTECCTFYVYGMMVPPSNSIYCDDLQLLGTISPGRSFTRSVYDRNKTLYLKVQETAEPCGLRNNDSEHYVHGGRNYHQRYELD